MPLVLDNKNGSASWMTLEPYSVGKVKVFISQIFGQKLYGHENNFYPTLPLTIFIEPVLSSRVYRKKWAYFIMT